MSGSDRFSPWFGITAGFMCLVCAFTASRIEAAEKGIFPADFAELRGIITNVDTATGSFIIATEVTRGVPGPDVRVFTNPQTVILIDGQAGVFAMLRPEMFVTVAPPNGVAAVVDAHTTGPSTPSPEAGGVMAKVAR